MTSIAARSAMLPFVLLAACKVDIVGGAKYSPSCAQSAPRLAGSWVGTVQNKPLTVLLTETCEGPVALFDGDKWVARGQWTWSDLSGPAEIQPFADDTPELLLSVGPLLQSKGHVRLVFTIGQIPAASSLTGYVVGTWPKESDPTQLLASFDSAAVTLARR